MENRGNLLVRDITPFVKEENVVDSEILTTLFVVIPKYAPSLLLSRCDVYRVC